MNKLYTLKMVCNNDRVCYEKWTCAYVAGRTRSGWDCGGRTEFPSRSSPWPTPLSWGRYNNSLEGRLSWGWPSRKLWVLQAVSDTLSVRHSVLDTASVGYYQCWILSVLELSSWNSVIVRYYRCYFQYQILLVPDTMSIKYCECQIIDTSCTVTVIYCQCHTLNVTSLLVGWCVFYIKIYFCCIKLLWK